MTGQKLGFPDSGTCDWPIEIIETIEPMQKVQENSCQSCKKSDNIWGKYTPWEISPICLDDMMYSRYSVNCTILKIWYHAILVTVLVPSISE